MNRSLLALLRLRRLEVEAARRVLAEAVGAEAAAERSLALARDAPRLEAQCLGNDSGRMRNFTAWLPHATAAMQSAEAALAAASRHTTAARLGLGDRQAACKAVETLVEQAELAARKHAARREGHALDEVVRQRRQ